jgi:Leucine-rich repeat (LRR) protein
MALLSLLSLAVAASQSADAQPPAGKEVLAAIQRIKDLGGSVEFGKDKRTVKEISLKHSKVTDEDLAFLSLFPDLSSLQLDDTDVTGKGLAHVAKAKNLTWLTCCRTKIKNDDLKLLPLLPKLRTFWVADTSIGDEGLKHLSECKSLENVTVGDSAVTDKGIKYLLALPNLKSLSASYTGLTDKALEHIGQMKQLTRLSLSVTRISDKGIVHLRGLEKLEMLLVDGCRGVTDESLDSLPPNLRFASFLGTEVTPEAKNKLKSARPKCIVE